MRGHVLRPRLPRHGGGLEPRAHGRALRLPRGHGRRQRRRRYLGKRGEVALPKERQAGVGARAVRELHAQLHGRARGDGQRRAGGAQRGGAARGAVEQNVIVHPHAQLGGRVGGGGEAERLRGGRREHAGEARARKGRERRKRDGGGVAAGGRAGGREDRVGEHVERQRGGAERRESEEEAAAHVRRCGEREPPFMHWKIQVAP